MSRLMIAAALVASFAAPAFAEETIVREHHESPGAAVRVPGVDVRVGGTGCDSKTVHRENGAGDSQTVHSTNCN